MTGLPGSGKSTAFMFCVERLREGGHSVGGIFTPEIRSRGRRIGFSVVDIATGRKAPLAGVDVISKFRVGRYGVDVSVFESVALTALDYAEMSCEVVCIDEIGRMELFSEPFKRKVEGLIMGSKPMVCVLHRDFIRIYGGFGKLFHVFIKNRDDLPRIVVSGLEQYLKQSRDR